MLLELQSGASEYRVWGEHRLLAPMQPSVNVMWPTFFPDATGLLGIFREIRKRRGMFGSGFYLGER